MVGNDNCVRYDNGSLQIPPGPHGRHYVRRRVRVHERADGQLSVFHGPRRLGRHEADGSPAATAQRGGARPFGSFRGLRPRTPEVHGHWCKGRRRPAPAASPPWLAPVCGLSASGVRTGHHSAGGIARKRRLDAVDKTASECRQADRTDDVPENRTNALAANWCSETRVKKPATAAMVAAHGCLTSSCLEGR